MSTSSLRYNNTVQWYVWQFLWKSFSRLNIHVSYATAKRLHEIPGEKINRDGGIDFFDALFPKKKERNKNSIIKLFEADDLPKFDSTNPALDICYKRARSRKKKRILLHFSNWSSRVESPYSRFPVFEPSAIHFGRTISPAETIFFKDVPCTPNHANFQPLGSINCTIDNGSCIRKSTRA